MWNVEQIPCGESQNNNFPLLLITAIWIFLSLICLTPTTFVRLTVANEKSVVAGGKQSIKINDENN